MSIPSLGYICCVVQLTRAIKLLQRDAHTEHRFKCTVCPKAFHRRASFLLHSRNHERLSKELAAVDTKKLKVSISNEQSINTTIS